MAWKYGHKHQMLMDGTFGTCTARVLTFILMAIDDNGKGIPVAFIIFTARKHAKAVHADYNGALLEMLLGQWKRGMGKHPETGEEFEIAVANTDNDPRERHALSHNWSDVFLLLCRFHTWQSW